MSLTPKQRQITINHSLFETTETKVLSTLSHNDFTLKQIHKLIFPSDSYNEKKLRYYLSDLAKKLEGIVIELYLKENEIEATLLRVKFYKQQKLKNEWNQALSQYQDQIKKLPLNHETKSYHQSQHAFYKYHFHLTFPQKEENEMTLLGNYNNYLNEYFFNEKLILATEFVNHSLIFKSEESLQFISPILEIQNNTPTSSFNHLYTLIYNCLNNLQNDTLFEQFKSVFIAEIELFTRPEKRIFFSYLQNLCIKKINLGNGAFLKELFNAYQLMIKYNVLVVNENLSIYDFKNICTVAFRLKEMDWAKNFIQHQSNLLDIKEKENAIAYNLANFYYHLKQYKEAKKLISKVEFSDLIYALDARSLLLKVYFESDDSEPLYNLFIAFKVFVVRNKTLTESQKLVYLNLIKYSKRVYDYRLKGKPLVALRNKINDPSLPMAAKSWLLQQMDD